MYMDYTTLKTNPSNPRLIKKEQFERLKKSIGGFTKMLEVRPIAYDEGGVIWGGNMRYEALKALGIEMKPEYFKELKGFTLEEKREFAIRDNIELGEWDDDILANEWSDLPLDDWGIDTKGWEKEVEEDEVPEVSEEEPKSKLGEVYQLGRHRLMCGDSTKIEDVEKLMNGQKADMVFTDPPYNIAGESQNFASDVSKSMKDLKNSEWDKNFNPEDFLNLLPLVVAEDATIYIFTSHFLFGDVYKQLKTWNDFVLYCVWSKPNPMPSLSKRHWTWNTELCLYATRGKHTFNFPNEGHELSTWTTTKESDGSHPTQKPIELCVKPISKSSSSGDLVIDPFGGSGSTLIACEQLDRTCYMMEIDPKYCDVIRKRYWKFTHDNNEEGWEDGTK